MIWWYCCVFRRLGSNTWHFSPRLFRKVNISIFNLILIAYYCRSSLHYNYIK
jgi:hypothetical protein